MSTIERRLNKLEEIRDRNDVGNEVDKRRSKRWERAAPPCWPISAPCPHSVTG
jgi:hypothetical protein